MSQISHIRYFFLMLIVILSADAWAQTKGDIKARINSKGNVTVQAPDALSKRNNSDLNRPSARKAKSDADASGHEDDDKDKKKDKKDDKREEARPPKRNHTSQQTIQSHGVGYRIQCYSDNSTNTAKPAAQQRARTIAMKFPQYRSYISYNAPSWRLRIGDFKSQEEAQKALQRLRAAFPSFGREMIIVRDRINIWGN